MPMILTDEQEMLRDAAKGFLTDTAPVSQLRNLRDRGDAARYDATTWSAMADMGWNGILVPEDHGGVDMGHRAAGLLLEEMGRTLTASPFLSTAMVGTTALKSAGSADQQAEWLPRIATGDAILAVATDEGRKHNPAHVEVTAERAGNGFKLSGTKTFVPDAGNADAIIVSARTAGRADEEAGVTLFLVPTASAGLDTQIKDMIDSRHTADITLDGVELTADAVLGEVDGGFAPLNHALNSGRAGVAAEMVGTAKECLDRTVSYLKERKQFGQIIGSFQALQHRSAHLYSEIQLAEAVVIKALDMLDTAPDHADLMVSAAKAKLGEVALLSSQEAIQMHGGIGMTDEFDIGFFIKRVRVADALFGDAAFHTARFASLRGF